MSVSQTTSFNFSSPLQQEEGLNSSSKTVNKDKVEVFNTYVQKMKSKLEDFVGNLASESAPTDPAQQEKIDRRDKCLSILSYVPGIGTGVTVFKEKAIADKLKQTFDPIEKLNLLKKQKELRFAALIRTIISVAIAVLLIFVAILTGGASVALGLGLMGGALALGSGFAGYWASQMVDSKLKLKPFEKVEEITTGG